VANWDFTRPDSRSWNWISSLNSVQQIDAAVTAILGPSPRRSGANVDPYHWDNDANILRSVLAFSSSVATRPVNAADLVKALRIRQNLGDRLYGRSGAPGFDELDALLTLSEEDFGRRVHGAMTALSTLATPAVSAVTTLPDIEIDRQVTEHRLWVVGTPMSGDETSKRLASLALGLSIQRAAERHHRGAQSRPLVLFIDEASLVADRVGIDVAVSQFRAAGVSVVLGLQNLDQLDNSRMLNTILGNTATQLFFSGANPSTVAYISRRLGTRPQSVGGVTRTGRDRHFSTGVEQVPVLGPREIENLWGGNPAALVLLDHPSRTRKPILVDLFRSDAV
jgi:hypothetical protein